MIWLGGRDSNPDSQIQSLESYHWTTSQQEEFEFTYPSLCLSTEPDLSVILDAVDLELACNRQ